MQVQFYFHQSSDVEPHIADIDIIPRRGDFIDLPEVSTLGKFPVESVIFLLKRVVPDSINLQFPDTSPAVRIYLGDLIEDQGVFYRLD